MELNYGILYYGGLVLAGGAIIAWCLVWSRRVRERRAAERFRQILAGYKFNSWKELKAHWHERLDFNLVGEFDPNRHGNLHETLKKLNEAAEAEWARWNA